MIRRIRLRAEPDVLHQEEQLDDGEHAIENDEAPEAEPYVADGDARCRQEGRQDAVDRPRLAAVLGHEPAELAGDPGKRQDQHRETQEPCMTIEVTFRRKPECKGEKRDEEEADRDHEAERPEEREHVWHRVPGRLRRSARLSRR